MRETTTKSVTMKTRTLLLAGVALLLCAGAASAGGARDRVDVGAIAQESGLTERQVRMVLGKPSSYAEYRTSYRTAERKLRAILGDARVTQLVAQARAGGLANGLSAP